MLEAVVALSIFAMGATALYSWINAELISLNRMVDLAERYEHRENAIEFMQAVNPAVRPTGETAFGATTIEWRAGAPTVSSTVLDDQWAPSINNAALYITEVSVFRDQLLVDRFSMTQLGLQQVRDESPFN